MQCICDRIQNEIENRKHTANPIVKAISSKGSLYGHLTRYVIYSFKIVFLKSTWYKRN